MLNRIIWNRTIYLYKIDLALNNLQRLIWRKSLTNKQTKIKLYLNLFLVVWYMNVSVKYLNNSGVIPNTISSKYSLYIFAFIFDNSKSRAELFFLDVICQSKVRSLLSVNRKLSSPSGYLFGFWCVAHKKRSAVSPSQTSQSVSSRINLFIFS